MGDWDDATKLLARAHPQDLVSFVLPGTRYLAEINNEFKVSSMRADFLCRAELDGEEIIVHVEFQRTQDDEMGRRTWEYNCAATMREDLTVYSFVVYLVKAPSIEAPPFRINQRDGRAIHTFEYTNILLWELPPETLMQKGMEGLLPLLPLTKGAKEARDTIIETMTTGLQKAGKEDVLPLGYAFAGLMYTTPEDKQAIKRRMEMLEPKLEKSWYYQEIIEKGLQKGLEQGIEQGKQQGKQEGLEQGRQQGGVEVLRSMLIRVVKKSFPDLLSLAQEVAERSTVPAVLDAKVEKLLVAETAEEARQVLEEGE